MRGGLPSLSKWCVWNFSCSDVTQQHCITNLLELVDELQSLASVPTNGMLWAATLCFIFLLSNKGLNIHYDS